MKRGVEIELTIDELADRGKGLGWLDGRPVFVPATAPGDRVRARVRKTKRKTVEADLVEIVQKGLARTDPKCPKARDCGGCSLQHVDYSEQLRAKERTVVRAIERIAQLPGTLVRPIVACETPYYYRNKMEFSFSSKRWLTASEIASDKDFRRDWALGLHAPGFFDKVIDLDACYLQSELSSTIVNGVRTLAERHEWPAWDIKNHQGLLRHLFIRHGTHTGQTMVNLVASRRDEQAMALLSDYLQSLGDVTTALWTIHDGPAQVAFGSASEVLFGEGVIQDRIGSLTFEIAPQAFFQTNTRQAQELYAIASEKAQITQDDLVYDLYCGAGTISLYLAPQARHVVGVELVPEAIQNARRNAQLNDIANVTFEQGDMLKVIKPEFVEKHGAPSVVIVDPPRAGIHPKVLHMLNEIETVERLVYVSCNPQTLAQDLVTLGERYTVDEITPVDMFPQTFHIEAVARLTRKT